MKTKKMTVRTLLEEITGESIPTRSELFSRKLALRTAPIWDTILYVVRFILTVYSIFEFPVRMIFSARLRYLWRQFRQARKNNSPLPSPGFYTSPTVGKLLTLLADLHRRYVNGQLQTGYEGLCSVRWRADAFTEVFDVKLEEELNLDTLATRVDDLLLRGCREVRQAQTKGFRHAVNRATEAVQDMAVKALQFGLWPKDDKFVTWIRQINKGRVEERFILTYFFCVVDCRELPVPKDAKPKALAGATSGDTADGGTEEPA